MAWTYDADTETWFYGTQKIGVGVFQDEKGWEANVCYFSEGIFLGPFATKEDAMEDGLEWLDKLIDAN